MVNVLILFLLEQINDLNQLQEKEKQYIQQYKPILNKEFLPEYLKYEHEYMTGLPLQS